MNSEQADSFAQEWIDAWNSHDLNRIIQHYAELLEFTSPLVKARYPDSDGTLRTRAELETYFAIGLAQNPSLRFQLIEVLSGVAEITLYYENARGGRTAELVRFDDAGKVIRSSACYTQASPRKG